MNRAKNIFTLILGTSLLLPAQAQTDTLSYAEQFALLEIEMDSMNIFLLIDSVLKAEYKPKSEVSVRIGYSSNVLSAGRNYGVDQHGLSPGLAFYHKSGAYGDVSGYWNSEFDPHYNLTMIDVGYMGLMGKHWSYTGSYERWFYHTGSDSSSSNNLKNSLGASLTHNTRFAFASVQYSYLFGREAGAHRATGNLSGTIRIGKWWIFKSIQLFPSASILYGNQNVIIRFEGDLLDEIRTNEYLRQNIFNGELLALLTEEERRTVQSLRQRDSRFARARILNIYLSNQDVVNYLYELLDEEENQYGIMNYSFSLPVSLNLGKLSLLLSYTYSIPVRLPGEEFTLDPIGYFSTTLNYRIPFK